MKKIAVLKKGWKNKECRYGIVQDILEKARDSKEKPGSKVIIAKKSKEKESKESKESKVSKDSKVSKESKESKEKGK
ncbi:MAG: hypothetical protein K5668_11500 [Lachnospiraceae bacterium]|nr:hypothetical protein [Lachnospiraceae bacterium]